MVKRCPETWGRDLAMIIVAGFQIDCEKHGLITALEQFLRTSRGYMQDGIDVEELLRLIKDRDKKVKLVEVKT